MPNPSLALGGYGEGVAHLHDQLAKQGYPPPAPEVARRFFGPGTRAVLLKYQAERGLECTGEVDEATAAVLERATVKASKAPTPSSAGARAERLARSDTRSKSATLQPISAPLRVNDRGPQVANLQDALRLLVERRRLDVSELATVLEALAGERTLELFGDSATYRLVQVFQAQYRLATSGAVDDETAAALNKLLSEIGVCEEPQQPGFIVRGQIRYADGRPADNITVRVMHKTLHAEEVLGETTTDSSGDYEISYVPGQHFAREKEGVNLVVRAFDGNGDVIASPVLFNAKATEIVDLTKGGLFRGPSEFDKLKAKIQPLGRPGMITLQKHVAYEGNVATTSVKSVAVVFELPVYEYATTGADGQSAARFATASTQTTSITQPLDSNSYEAVLEDRFVAGGDRQSAALAKQYYLTALQSGDVDDLLVTAVVRYVLGDTKELGQQRLELVCLPKLTLQPKRLMQALGTANTRSSYLAINRQAFYRLRKQLASAEVDIADSAILGAISALTVFDGNVPTLQDNRRTDLEGWLDTQATETTTADADKLLTFIESAFASLFDFALTIPEIRTLTVAGTLTIVPPNDTAVSAAAFRAYEISAELSYRSRRMPVILTYRFDDKVTVKDASAAFSLTGSDPPYRNDLRDPVRVTVGGIGSQSPVWSKDFGTDDTSLENLDIRVPLQRLTTLNAVPKQAEPDKAKKLRGRVLTFNTDCVLKDALVLVQAKTSAESAWKTVAAATTDGSGNFSTPYPYGKYVDAEAIVSLAPSEAASIAILQTDTDVTISDDFLYLLLHNPDCSAPTSEEDCECKSDGNPNRLPDYADLIESDAYSQDIGGSCVNLSKPNRTLSEFNFRAIVRTSDPDVANYTLTKIGTGLEAIDVSLAVSLASGSAALLTAQSVATELYKGAIGTEAYNAGVDHSYSAVTAVLPHVVSINEALAQGAPSITLSVLAATQSHIDAVIAILQANQAWLKTYDFGSGLEVPTIIDAAGSLRTLVSLAIDTVGTSARYELVGGAATRLRQPIALNNPIEWQDAPEQSMPAQDPSATFSQAVTIATGHILHYKALFKADGYSLGDLIYSLPLAPGQKKQIVVFDASHTLVGAESQALAQNERLAMGLVDEREITNQLAGNISESLRGSSSANTSGVSAGFGTGGQGYGGTGAYGGSGSAVLGIAGGVAQAGSTANQDSSRDVAQFFGEKLRQSIMQNAEGYRQLNASVVTTVQEGQRYGATSEVLVNHNHCHALTMMYFEVLRHYAIFQKLSSVEECVFVPFLMTRFSTENVAKWRDVLAPALLPMPSDTYLQPFTAMAGPGRHHPLIKAFDADQRIKTQYANVSFPAGSYDDEPIRFVKGELTLRVNFPRPRTRYDRILSFPIVTSTTTTTNTAGAAAGGAAGGAAGAIIGAAVGEALIPGIGLILGALAGGTAGGVAGANIGGDTTTTVALVKQQIFDLFMQLDANFQSVPPAQCIRIKSFQPTSYTFGGIPGMPGITIPISGVNFFENDPQAQQRWTTYAKIIGYSDVLKFLDNYFAGRLISEWDEIFNKEIAPAVFEALVESINITEINADFTSASNYEGGLRRVRLFIDGTTSKKRNQLPLQLKVSVNNADVKELKNITTVTLENVEISYSTAHYNGILYSSNVNNDLLDDTNLDIPENPDEKRNPRREDRYLAAKLIEHLNSNIEYYNKVLWFSLDPDRRYMLMDGFSIQVFEVQFDKDGTPVPAPAGRRSLASVVKNEVIAVAGNSLVLPVAPGYRVSGSYIQATKDGDEEAVTLFDHYKPLTPIEPFRISVPSKGVFAEAVQGACNACEKIETERLQDWSRFPIGDEPTAIAPITAPTPVVTDWRAAFKDFAAPIVNVQNAPAAPAPGAGLQGLSDLLGKSGVFKDITGLDANQQNAIRTYLSNQENAKAFAEMAKEMAMQSHNTQNSDRIMDSIKSAKESGAINQGEYGNLVKDHLQQQIDGGQTKRSELDKEKSTTPTPLTRAAINAATQGREVKAQTIDSDGNTESVDIEGGATETTLEDSLKKYSTPDVRAFRPGNYLAGKAADKSGKVTLRAVVPSAPSGSTWHWSVADATKAQIVSPSAHITDILAGHPGLVDLTFEARDSTGKTLATTSTKLCVPQFVAIEEDALAFNAQLAAFHLDDVKAALLQRVKAVVDFLMRNANVRTIWTIGPFNEALPPQFWPGGFAAGKYNRLTIHGKNAADPAIAGEVAPAGAGASKPDEPIDIWPGAFEFPGHDVGVEVANIVGKIKALNLTDPQLKSLWIDIMGRLSGENIAHEIHHALLAYSIPGGHNAPPIPWDLMNMGTKRSFLQRTGIEVLDSANFPQPNSYRDGGIQAISGLVLDLKTGRNNQLLVDAVFPVPPAFV